MYIVVFWFADTGCSTLSCIALHSASTLGPDGCVDGINRCNELTIGCWVLEVLILFFLGYLGGKLCFIL